MNPETHHDPNPYTPPTTESTVFRLDSRRGSFPLAIVACVGALAYLAFTIVLLRSTPVDRTSGWMFVVNVPVLGALPLFSATSLRVAARCGFVAAGVQTTIACIMLVLPIGDVEMVLAINGIIVGICLAIAGWAWYASRKQPPKSTSDPI